MELNIGDTCIHDNIGRVEIASRPACGWVAILRPPRAGQEGGPAILKLVLVDNLTPIGPRTPAERVMASLFEWTSGRSVRNLADMEKRRPGTSEAGALGLAARTYATTDEGQRLLQRLGYNDEQIRKQQGGK